MTRHILAAATVAASALGSTVTAHASGLSWSVDIATPAIGAVVSNDRRYAPVPAYVDAPVYAPVPVYVQRRPVLLAPPLPRTLPGARWIAAPAPEVVWTEPVRYVDEPRVVYRYEREHWNRWHGHHAGRDRWNEGRDHDGHHDRSHGRD
jgi:hypothetical protein